MEDTLFAVPRKGFLRDSEFFREMFDLPPEKDKPVEGSCIEHPLCIGRVRKEDLTYLLRAMYPSCGFHPLFHATLTHENHFRYVCQDDSLPCSAWVVILKLLTMWRFSRGRQSVLEKLKTIADPITKVLLWEEHALDAEEWLIPAVTAIARREQSLTIEEGTRLGLENVIRISCIRETYSCTCVRRNDQAWGCSNAKTCPSRGGGFFYAEIKKAFGVR